MKISMVTNDITLRFGFEKGYAMLREAGFEAVDWNLCNELDVELIQKGTYRGNILERPLEELLEYFAPELEAMRKNGLAFAQGHAPFPAYLKKDPELFPYMLEINEKCVRLFGAVGCKYLVIHGIKNQAEDEKIRALNWQLYASLIPALKETGVVVCLENLVATSEQGRWGVNHTAGICCDPQEAVDMVDRLNAEAGQECFGLCLDTGHLNLLRIDPASYIRQAGNRIKVLHIHDNNGTVDQHVAPYNGVINWQRFWEALKEINYRADLSFECFNQITYIPEDELIPSQLKAIQAVGELMRKKILEK